MEIDLSGEIAKKNINIFEYWISYYERTFEQGKKITIVDGILSYYFLLKSRFIKNNLDIQISLLYSIILFSYIAYTNIGGYYAIIINILFVCS